MTGRRKLAPKITRAFGAGHTFVEIAAIVGCSTQNVRQVLRRKGLTIPIVWRGFIAPLEPKHHEFLAREAQVHNVSVEQMIRALLVDAIELAIEEETELKCLTAKQLRNPPTPRTQSDRARPGSGPA